MRQIRVMRGLRGIGAVSACLAVAVLAVACSSGSTRPPLTPNLIAAFNRLYSHEYPATVMSPASSKDAPVVSQESAIATALRSCNNGADPSVVGVGLVAVTGSHGALWAVFVNPPGSHFLPNGAGTGGVTANWFVVLINAHAHESHAWSCAAGYYPRLPVLLIHM
jgi:hypothetical protein